MPSNNENRVEELRAEWKSLRRKRVDDHVHAEGIESARYKMKAKYPRILVLVLSSLSTLFFAICGMALTWNSMFFLTPQIKGFIALTVGIFGFAFGALLFWRLTELASIKRG